MNDKRSALISVLLLFLVTALLMHKQLLTEGYFSCIVEDAYTYTSWASQFVNALKEGIIYPRWMPLNYWGYGGPTFLLYPPLAFYLVGFFNLFTGSIISAMNVAKFMALFLSAVGMFFLVREFYSEKIAVLTASFYTIFPYNVFQFYYVGTFASTVSFMWFSPILLFIYRYMKYKQFKYLAFAGICYGGLILTHLINAYMFSFLMAAFIIYMSVLQKKSRDLIALPLVIIIGFGISAAYILPVIHEKQLLNMDFFIEKGGGFRFDIHNFFILPSSANQLPADHLWPVYYDTFVLHVLIFLIVIMLSLIQMKKMNSVKAMKNANTANRFFFIASILSMFLLFGVSTFIWELLPFSKYIQFPVRWLNITLFSVAVSSAAIFWSADRAHETKKRYIFVIPLIFLLCLVLDYKNINSSPIFSREVLLPARASNWNLEHLPAWVTVERIDTAGFREKAMIVRGEGTLDVVRWSSAQRVIRVSAAEPVKVNVRTFYFPGWKAYLGSIPIAITVDEDDGSMLASIPEGDHILEFRFEDTPLRYYSKAVSLASLLGISCLLLLTGVRKKAS